MKTKAIRAEVYYNAICKILLKEVDGSSILPSILERRIINENYILLPYEQYIINVDKRLKSLNGCIEGMLQIELFIRRFPDKKYFAKYDFNEPDYLEYHIKNAIVQTSSFRDMLLHLTNEILELGVEKHNVTSIRTYSGALKKMGKELSSVGKNGKLLELFDNYDEQIKTLKPVRNSHIHEGKFYDGTLSEINQSFNIISVTERFNGKIEPWMIRRYHYANWQLKNRRKELIELVQSQRDGMEQSLINYTKMLSGEFLHRVKIKSGSDE